MRIAIDPSKMTPEERMAEVAAILARGVLRLNTRSATGGEKPAESGRKPLDSGGKMSPGVSVVNAQGLSGKGDT